MVCRRWGLHVVFFGPWSAGKTGEGSSPGRTGGASCAACAGGGRPCRGILHLVGVVQKWGMSRPGAAAPEKRSGSAGSRETPGTVPPPMLRLRLLAPVLSAALHGAQGKANGSGPSEVWESAGGGTGLAL